MTKKGEWERVIENVVSMEEQLDVPHTEDDIEKIMEDALHLDKILEYDEENEFESSN
jgi:hypothetical protein